ncbi:Fur family transcriptional regulator [Kistimonas asteriae]|uniref:Fur family transcriptional regulator n=1 Tax=Kistimonas asteriae TaxID=517724 RepID=UPI001BAD6E33|nr:Fur family transcriptional regulator [Kistimonas asteriae]
MQTNDTAYCTHNHDQCIASALDQAETLCRRQGARLTLLRRQVLELVWQSHKPVGAYEILAMLSQTLERSAAPPTVYRALDFLQAQGLVHRIASLNAYIGCPHPEQPHESSFLICEKCRNTVELDNAVISTAIAQAANTSGFLVNHSSVELTGLCPNCRKPD